MTTIAWARGILAADSRMTAGLQLKSDRFKKIFTPKDSTILGQKVLAYALAGDASSQLVLKAVLAEGLDVLSTLESEDDFQAIVVTEESAYLVNKDSEKSCFGILEIYEDNHMALGSGSTVANYILQKGGDPVDAVVAAMSTDLGSGGDVVRWTRESEEI
jgi:hypothetical protein